MMDRRHGLHGLPGNQLVAGGILRDATPFHAEQGEKCRGIQSLKHSYLGLGSSPNELPNNRLIESLQVVQR